MCHRWSPLRRWSSQSSKSALVGIRKEAIEAAAASADTSATIQKNTKSPYYDDGQVMGRFSLPLTIKFLATTILLSTAAAFSIGCIARIALMSKFGVLPLSNHDVIASHIYPIYSGASRKRSYELPAPTVIPGKDVPFTTYSAKTFRVEGAATSHTLHIDRRGAATKVTNQLDEDVVAPIISSEDLYDYIGEARVQNASYEESRFDGEEDDDYGHVVNDYSHNNDADGLHLPAGQHLLVDIKDVDSEFLNSEVRLATAMVELIKESQLTLLSYHCHGLVPIGVSCAGVLLESHVAFHTWPKEGVITMDLFTCGGNPLLPVLSSIQKLFGIPRAPTEGEDEQEIPDPTMLWSHKLRGFRDGFAPGYDADRNPLDQDLGQHVLGKMDFDVKNQLVSEKTAFQTVDVYEVMNPNSRKLDSYHKSLSNDGSYESSHPELFGPDRVLFLDGVIQSTLYGDAPYHESIVHPAMITHPNPKRVAIIGGGEGATLREVLKHSTVEEAVMIEIDEGVVELSREHLPQWQDCSSIAHHEKAAEWCFDDKRATAKFEDAMAYFIDHFYDTNEQDEEPYDIVIMDALDPNDDIEFAVYLYTSETYIQSLYNSLTSNGILVVQVGEAPKSKSPADETGRFANRSIMQATLEKAGFKSIHVYEEAHSGFLAPWSTLVAFKDIRTRENWYRTGAEVELQLQKRILSTKSGSSSLRYFDGATMSSYQLPTAAFETAHCRKVDTPEHCDNTMGLVEASSMNETDKTTAYDPAFERHGREGLHSREYGLHNIQGWKEVLLN